MKETGMMPWENKKDTSFREWLLFNALGDLKNWDSQFLQYIEIRKDFFEKRFKEKSKVGYKTSDEKIYAGYLRRLDLDEEALRGKKILDLGCRTGAFVRTCVDKNLTRNIRGIDLELKGEAKNDDYADYFEEGNFKGVDFGTDLDLIIFKAALHGLISSSTASLECLGELVDILVKATNALSQAGEIRIGPVMAVLQGPCIDVKGSFDQVSEILIQNINMQYQFIPVDIIATNEGKNIGLDYVLIIKRK